MDEDIFSLKERSKPVTGTTTGALATAEKGFPLIGV